MLSKLLADLLTATRALMGIWLTLLGIQRGPEGLRAATATMLLSWITDALDGGLARHASPPRRTWIGDHDAEADLIISLGLDAYLTFSGYLPLLLGTSIFLTILILRLAHSMELAWPIYALPYITTVGLAFKHTPIWGWLCLAYLLAIALIRWPRLRDEYLPAFFNALRSLKRP